jgi:hypothetical protein
VGLATVGIVVKSDTTAWLNNVRVGEEIFSGSPFVAQVGAAILGKVDSLGPSKASGLNDPAQLWHDTLGITTISTAAETTLDSDGLTPFVDHCISGGVLISILGLGPYQAVDVQATDNTINGPELLRAGRILVTD